ncbi:hypothetical protein ACQP2P_41055 [Dactylosporangium sp. CA-139114]|uniref:hypothetical protein n=1 Tax=Dactylosporangium sp. CA-139114 TaxID=3239931 RepID=UPI003D9877EF
MRLARNDTGGCGPATVLLHGGGSGQLLLRRAPGPMVTLNHAVAVSMARGPLAGLSRCWTPSRRYLNAGAGRIPDPGA